MLFGGPTREVIRPLCIAAPGKAGTELSGGMKAGGGGGLVPGIVTSPWQSVLELHEVFSCGGLFSGGGVVGGGGLSDLVLQLPPASLLSQVSRPLGSIMLSGSPSA